MKTVNIRPKGMKILYSFNYYIWFSSCFDFSYPRQCHEIFHHLHC